GKGNAAVQGLCREWTERMAALDGAETWEEALQDWGIRFDPEAFKYVSDRLAQEAGVKLLLHSLVCGTAMSDGRMDALLLETKQGRLAVRGRVFVDATGDADLAFRGGLQTTKGRRFDGRPMAMGSMFRIRGLTGEHAKHMDAIRRRIEAAKESGELLVYGGPGGNGATMLDDELTPNVTRAAGDGTDVEQLTAAELKVRKDTWDIVRFYRENLPGFQNVRLEATPMHVGVRETRQAVGDYVMTGRDIVEARKQPDGIARASYWIDIHCCLGYTKPPAHVCSQDCGTTQHCPILEDARDELPAGLFPPEGDWADVPYRSLTVKGASNLLSSGRCISADHHAMGAVRVMATCMALGQAAGTAAAMAADSRGGDVRAVDTDALRAKLTADGALV
ncbi:MAG: FAD-dependent oxidoreductase, partial [Candidatus Brocadiae bacterium]|nr:FAD-dependent oxidoreductase [Candidatus Brocadiia bacterium]